MRKVKNKKRKEIKIKKDIRKKIKKKTRVSSILPTSKAVKSCF